MIKNIPPTDTPVVQERADPGLALDLQPELDRIRAAYLHRDRTVPRSRYSVFHDGHLLEMLELQRRVVRFLKQFRHVELERMKILDIGCGKGTWLREFIQWGARPENLYGVDLLPNRIQEAESLCPVEVRLTSGDASQLPFEDHTFDLVSQFTVFTSILEPEMRRRVAVEMTRVLTPGGAILWYDYFISKPTNPDTRGVSRREISELFPKLKIHLERITLAPPLGNRIAPISPLLYQVLSQVKPLCTHYIGLFLK